jgi:hypothetical protein
MSDGPNTETVCFFVWGNEEFFFIAFIIRIIIKMSANEFSSDYIGFIPWFLLELVDIVEFLDFMDFLNHHFI